ncbi:Serpentine Receptor, class U [Caenorhabditis elegans]|uniref:Serpentine Receptor, class U n=1 Tax=Caenorhabditis elegans TaxID=6239 RepID=Q18730_CAEEL|nr:Serpentine Receptor, class U [Caenorhabditis elegans]CAA96609.1 Serpentine Receptor, class U [Caenorhabditis elegans]|eukprot:NP_505533.1 Serpentine Receptor, class U [Caenorhabditis elegans]
MVTLFPANQSIHGMPAYMSYATNINFTTMQAFVPFIYIIPTSVIMIVILMKYRTAKMMMNTASMDPNIFVTIMFYFFFNILFFIGDYVHLNLPSSGLVTSWCAGTQPGWPHTLIVTFAYFGDYGTLSSPFLASLIRLVMILSPHNHGKYCRLLMRRFVFPFIIIVPFSLSLISLPATGYCKQLGPPFNFGAIIVFESDFFAKINVIVHLSLSNFTFIGHYSLSAYMFFKIRKTTSNTSNQTRKLSRKAELSLTLTMASCIIPYITNSIVSYTFLFDRNNWPRVLFLRVIGNDYETLMMPWVLFFTHPLFLRNKIARMNTNQGSSIWNSGSNTPRRSSQKF